MKTEWKVLYDEESRETTGKINIGMQYIYDPVKLSELKIHQKEEESLKVEEEYVQLAEFYKRLSCNPIFFNKHLLVPIETIITKNFQDSRDEEVMSYRGKRKEAGGSMLGSYEEQLCAIEELMNEKVSAFVSPQTKWSSLAYATTCLYASLSCLIVFAREDFINVIYYYCKFYSLYFLSF